jgi:hypothetical protein
MVMIKKMALLVLAFGVMVGTMAVPALADHEHGMDQYGPSGSSATNEPQPDSWEFREAMETGALPGQTVGSSEAVCCRGIEGPTIESGGQLFRPEIDSGA